MTGGPGHPPPSVELVSAITLATHDMARAVRFYRDAVGLPLVSGGEQAAFSSFAAGRSFVNLVVQPESVRWSWWGRVILHVADVDALAARLSAAGARLQDAPRDAPWGERYFHVTDPDGHELSFAKPLDRGR